MSKPGQFKYSQGSAFVREGYLYYSPNCQRHVVIDPYIYGDPSPFKIPRLNISAFRQPVWWSESWGWMSFIPLALTFLSYPFEPFSWMPKIVQVEVSLRAQPDQLAGVVTKFQMHHADLETWRHRESLLVDAARLLRLNHSISAGIPPLPSSFGYDKPHRSLALAKCMISLSRDWFGVWMGYLSFIIQQTSTSPTSRPTPSDRLHPHWYQQLLDDHSKKWTQPWLDGVIDSPICLFDATIVRAGIVIPWSKEDSRRPPIDFFLQCNIPCFFPWTLEAENALSRDSRLEYLRPPTEIIQQALTFILSAPGSVPLAALIIKRYCSTATEFKDPASARVLKLQDSPSDVVALARTAFLKQYESLSEVDADEVLRQAIEAHHTRQEEHAAADAALPQQSMIVTDNPGQQRVYIDWKEFFRARAARRPAIIDGASQKILQTHRNRKLNPPIKNTTMFVWESVETPGGIRVFTRRRAVKAEFEDLLEDEEDGEETPRVYDEVVNEWDMFPEFVVDTESPVEEGVPRFRFPQAPPRRYVSYDDLDSEDEASPIVPFDATPTSPRPLSPPPRPPLGPLTPPSRPLSPLPRPRSPSAPAAHSTTPVQSLSEVSDEKDISLSTPMFEALDYNYGFTRPMVPSTTTPNDLKLLDWRGVGLALGYVTLLPQDQEDLAVKIFVSSLATKKVPPAELDDLNPKNFTSLQQRFDFRNIIRLLDNTFIFTHLSSPDHEWQLGVTCTEALLYIIRYLLANPEHGLITVVHRLLKFGIPFNTLIHRRTNSVTYECPIRDRYRDERYVFTRADFDSAMISARYLLEGPVGRAALMRGGIIGRIAREFL